MAKTNKNNKATTEDLVLGKQVKKTTKKIVDYENENVLYKVTNLRVDNIPAIVSGDLIESFIGCNNKEARKALKQGAKSVITKDDKVELYKIEVL